MLQNLGFHPQNCGLSVAAVMLILEMSIYSLKAEESCVSILKIISSCSYIYKYSLL